jgi:hypothetical protein
MEGPQDEEIDMNAELAMGQMISEFKLSSRIRDVMLIQT